MAQRTYLNYKIPLTVSNVRKYYVEDGLTVVKTSEIMGVPVSTLAKFIRDNELKRWWNRPCDKKSTSDERGSKRKYSGKYNKNKKPYTMLSYPFVRMNATGKIREIMSKDELLDLLREDFVH